MILEKLSKKIGFTETEIKVILFLAAAFLAGITLKLLFKSPSINNSTFFDYSQQDSLFNLYSGMNQNPDETEDTTETLASIKKEVLGISEEKTWQTSKKVLPQEKSININSANIDELTKLPGIGTKTAEKIIEHRTNMGGFKQLEDLMDVKGIGEVKFNNIKKFLYIK